MGLMSWLQHHVSRGDMGEQEPASESRRDDTPAWPGPGWEPLPAYLPVNAKEHVTACVIASAIAAGDHPESALSVKSVSVANPEHQRVACIAAALAAGARRESALKVTRIYKRAGEEETHAA